MPPVSKAAFLKTCQPYVRDANFKLKMTINTQQWEILTSLSKEKWHINKY